MLDQADNTKSNLGNNQRIFLLFFALLLACFLFFLREGFDSRSPLDVLARNSLEPEVALKNGRPTVLEFYADWCEACREMAPSMMSNKKLYQNNIDVVLVNVDNEKWTYLIDKYNVNGIPHLSLFDSDANLKGTAIGVKSEEEISKIILALLENKRLPEISGISFNSSINNIKSTSKLDYSVSPRDHF
tara:strand:+ start:901 stop:1464 length:564 start_codon:yes stop_codon:yes gene_type:complete